MFKSNQDKQKNEQVFKSNVPKMQVSNKLRRTWLPAVKWEEGKNGGQVE